MTTRRSRPWTALPLFALAVGCGPTEGLPGAGARGALVGMDGDKTVAGTETLNRYAVLGATANRGDSKIVVAGAAALRLVPGDLILLYQAQGAAIDVAPNTNFGNVTNLGTAGRYELVTVAAVNGDQVTLDPSCTLRSGYDARGGTQVVRVPQFRTLTVPRGARVTAPAWDGSSGGVVAVHVQSDATVDGDVDVSGLGFRGGRAGATSLPPGRGTLTIASPDPQSGGEKGESIAGDQVAYGRLNVRYGRGAPANGGGGGSSHNAPGGGGGGGDNGRPYSGAGVMDQTVVGSAAYRVDPAFAANGNTFTDSSGGGRGGYSYSISLGPNNPSPLTVGPGDARWGGDQRRTIGGLGGRALRGDAADRVFFGGGGGGGDGNNDAAANGANGGGLVLVISNRATGSGALRADGASGPANRNGFDDAPGGGGGGGAVVLSAQAPISGLTLSASGGKGGDQPSGPVLLAELEAEGPGGGGGGGAIYATLGDGPRTIAGGPAGTTASPFVAAFPSNGATRGASGQVVAAANLNIPVCLVAPAVDMGGSPDMTGTVGPDLSGPAGADLSGPSGADLAGPGKSYAGGGFTCAAAPGVPSSPGGLALLGLGLLALLRRRRTTLSPSRSGR